METVTFRTEDWKYVVAVVEKALRNSRDALEQKSTTPEDTAFHRGKVALAKEILKLPELPQLPIRD